MSLVSVFENTFKKFSEKIALEYKENIVKFKEISDDSNKIANALSKHGVKKGDRVALYLPNSLELIYFFVGILKNGSIVVPMNNTFKEKETSHILKNSGAKAVLTSNECLPIVKNIMHGLKDLKLVIIPEFCAVEEDKKLNIPLVNYEEFLVDCSSNFPIVDISDEDGSIMFYTSGTTGIPKGALLSHRNMESDLKSLKEQWFITDKDSQILTLPLFHIHGLGVALSLSFYCGYSLIIKEKFNAEEVLSLIQEKKLSLFMGVPAMYIKILQAKNKEKYDLSSMRLFVSGSAPLPSNIFSEFKKIFGHEILERAGMSETNMNFSNPYNGERKPGTVGLPLSCCQVKIVGKDYKEVPNGKEGEILLKGQNVFKGYWNDAQKTEKSFHDGWFITGDIGKIDEDGYVTFLGRNKDLIISGGLNIYPTEVEEVINSHPLIQESAVVGIYDNYFGEAVKAYIVTKKGSSIKEKELIEYCKEKIASYKKPKHVEFLDSLPKNAMGKVQKNVLRGEKIPD